MSGRGQNRQREKRATADFGYHNRRIFCFQTDFTLVVLGDLSPSDFPSGFPVSQIGVGTGKLCGELWGLVGGAVGASTAFLTLFLLSPPCCRRNETDENRLKPTNHECLLLHLTLKSTEKHPKSADFGCFDWLREPDFPSGMCWAIPLLLRCACIRGASPTTYRRAKRQNYCNWGIKYALTKYGFAKYFQMRDIFMHEKRKQASRYHLPQSQM